MQQPLLERLGAPDTGLETIYSGEGFATFDPTTLPPLQPGMELQPAQPVQLEPPSAVQPQPPAGLDPSGPDEQPRERPLSAAVPDRAAGPSGRPASGAGGGAALTYGMQDVAHLELDAQDYHLGRQLGEGSFATVFLATQVSTGKT